MLAPTSRRHWAATYIPLCLLLILAFNLLPQSDPDSRHGVDVFRGIKHALNPSEASIYAMPATYSTIEEHNEAKSTDTLASKMTALYENLAETANRTLGFEKIFALSLPGRSDKRDAITLMASLTNLSINFVDGVISTDVPDAALPPAMDRGNIRNSLGAWRGHLNALQTIVRERISSALILEDDQDWDVRIHDQARRLAIGSRHVQGVAEDMPTHSAYGDDWDVLWIGHCGETMNKEEDGGTYIMGEDPTVPNVEDIKNDRGEFPFQDFPSHSRFVQKAVSPLCTLAYAVSYRGAQKILYEMSLLGSAAPFDIEMRAFVAMKKSDGVSISVTPSIFNSYHGRGPVYRDSDINADDRKAEDQSRDKDYTDNVVWSTRMNAGRLLLNQAPIDQFEEIRREKQRADQEKAEREKAEMVKADKEKAEKEAAEAQRQEEERLAQEQQQAAASAAAAAAAAAAAVQPHADEIRTPASETAAGSRMDEIQ